MENLNEIIAKNIRKIREEKKLSQDYIAAQLSISQNVYSRLESGKVNFSIDRLLAIANVLETQLLDLIGQTNYTQSFNIQNNQTIKRNVTNNLSEEMTDLYKKLIQLSIEQKDIMSKHIEVLYNAIKKD